MVFRALLMERCAIVKASDLVVRIFRTKIYIHMIENIGQGALILPIL
jgi:hypothetical protein